MRQQLAELQAAAEAAATDGERRCAELAAAAAEAASQQAAAAEAQRAEAAQLRQQLGALAGAHNSLHSAVTSFHQVGGWVGCFGSLWVGRLYA